MSKKPADGSVVRLDLLLRPEWRGDARRASVAEALRHCELTPTGFGAATVSARATHETFARLFGVDAKGEPRAVDAQALRVPESLNAFVQNVSVAPRPTYMGGDTSDVGDKK